MSLFDVNSIPVNTSLIKGRTCVQCGRLKNCTSPNMPLEGKFKKKILLVGSFPTQKEDEQGSHWRTKGGSFLAQELAKYDIDLKTDCLSTFAVNCYDETVPTKKQVFACRSKLQSVIAQNKPHIIFLFGEEAVSSVIGLHWKKGKIGLFKFRGYIIPDQQYQAFLVPIAHPDDVLKDKNPAALTTFKNDLKKAVKYVTTPFPNYKKDYRFVKILDTRKEIVRYLKHLLTVDSFAWDVETTGLKPHDTSKHKILIVSFAESAVSSVSFVIPQDKLIVKLLKKVLVGKAAKVAQNLKYETTWARNIWKAEVNNWVWDTMIGAHMENSIPGVTGLKFQTYINFGVSEYDAEVNQWLKSPGKSANEVNRLEEFIQNPINREAACLYCGLDSLYTYRLYEIQRLKFTEKERDTMQFMVDGLQALSRAEQQGMRIDMEYVQKMKKRLTRKIEHLEKKFNSSSFARQWKHIYGEKTNYNSGYQLEHLLYKVKKLKPPKTTEHGGGSTDDETLRSFHIPELDVLLKIRKLKKVKDTYLENFSREVVDNYMHPFFNLHTARTFRSSSQNPNFQNIPKRDKEAMQLIRQAIYPRKGHQLLEADFGALEVSIAYCYHKDPVMKKYLTSKHADMHSDMAKQIFMIPNFDKHIPEHKFLRSATKNSFVFPQFYGSYYKGDAISFAKWLDLPHTRWKSGMGVSFTDGKHIADHFIDNGIHSFTDLENHLQKIEFDFWNKRFKAYKRWKDSWLQQYQRRGYFEMHTGFRVSGVLRRNEVINYPVQGAAFHCLLYSFIEMDKWLCANNMDTKLIGQIHDAMILDVHPDEREQVIAKIKEITTQQLPSEWKWITIPLTISIDIAGVDESWAKMKEL